MFRCLVLTIVLAFSGCIFNTSPTAVGAPDADVGATDDGGSTEDSSTEDDMVVMIEPEVVFVVTRSADDVDDANCFENDCTLRQAINAALAQTERVAIMFSNAVFQETIVLGSELPIITACHVIDAGANPALGFLTISAPTASAPIFRFDGLRCGDNRFATVRGIRFADSPAPAVIITDSDRVLVERNMMDGVGTAIASNDSSSNVWVWDNVIINSRRHGAVLFGTEILFERNFVGVLPDDNPGPNAGHGVWIGASDTIVSDNIISENGLDGLVIDVREPGESVNVIGNTFGREPSNTPQKASVVVYNGEVVIGGERQGIACDGPCNRFVAHDEFGLLIANAEEGSVVSGNVFGTASGQGRTGIGVGRLRGIGASCETGTVCDSGVCLREKPINALNLGGSCIAACDPNGDNCSGNTVCRLGGCVPENEDSPDVDINPGQRNTINIGSGTLFPNQAVPEPCIGSCNVFRSLEECGIESRGPLLLNIMGNQFGGDVDSGEPQTAVCLSGDHVNNATISGNVIDATNIGVIVNGFQNTVDDNLIKAVQALSFPSDGWLNRAEGNLIDSDLTKGDSGFASFDDNGYLGAVEYQNEIRAPSLQAVRMISNNVQITLSNVWPNANVGLIAVTATGSSHIQSACTADNSGDAVCDVSNLVADTLIGFSKVQMRVYDLAGTNGAVYSISNVAILETSPPLSGVEIETAVNNATGAQVAFAFPKPEGQLGARIGILTYLGETLSGSVTEFASGEVHSSFSDSSTIAVGN